MISPVLANIYLHEVLDAWFYREVRPRMRGRATLARYADDFVIVFSDERDARAVMDVLPKRFGKYGLTLHPDKTRLVPFRRPPKGTRTEDPGPGTFDLLGFTHYWDISRKGNWVVKRKTARDRFTRSVRRVREWCRLHRHRPIHEQWVALKQKLRGHFNYFGIVGNSRAIERFRFEVIGAWWKWLNRRSNRARVTWEKMHTLLERYPLPRPRIAHPLGPRVANP